MRDRVLVTRCPHKSLYVGSNPTPASVFAFKLKYILCPCIPIGRVNSLRSCVVLVRIQPGVQSILCVLLAQWNRALRYGRRC